MNATPLIDAVRRAGGTILVRGEHLRLCAPSPLPDILVAELRQHKAEILDLLRTSGPAGLERQPPDASPARTVETHVERWHRGVERLGSMPLPRGYPEHAWRQLTINAERFLHGWANQAARLGCHIRPRSW